MIRIGMMIGDRYEILERIGTGGMSDVYKAKDHKLNRHVAVKVLKQEFSENTNFVSKFRVEAQAAASLMHPNIVNVYDVGEENGVYYIVMELVEGITLKKYIEKKARLSFKEAVSIAIQACMGIEAAHKNHIIHRDIKPQNIIISKDGKVKVTDFGIAKAATSNTITSNVMGSVHYTSPEQARGGYSDEKSDIYSMGITLFEMLTGRVPFNGETTVAIAIKHIQEQMPSPRDFVSEIPVSVEQIVLKCTQKSPDRRYHTMAALIEDLKKSLMSPDEDFVRIGDADESMATRNAGKEQGEVRKQTQTRKKEPEKEQIRLKKNSSGGSGTQSTSKKKKTQTRVQEEESYEDSRMERITTVLAVIGAILIGCAVIFLVGRTMGIFQSDQESSQVPMIAVSGMTEQEAVEALRNAGLAPEVVYENSDAVQPGYVISANVKENAIVASGSRVVLTVSGQAQEENGIPVPSVQGLLEAEATATLKKNGFEVAKSEGYSDTVEKGRIISQSPAGDTRAEAGTTVSIVISQGPNTDSRIPMPDIIGQDPMTAIAILTESGLMVGEQKDMNDDNEQFIGKVCYASYSVGALVEPGTAIDIGISIGPAAATYMYTEAVESPADLDPEYREGTQCTVTITGQSGKEYFKTTVSSFPITTVNLHGLDDPAAAITYEYYVEGAAQTQINGNGETVTVPGERRQQVVQRTVRFTPEG